MGVNARGLHEAHDVQHRVHCPDEREREDDDEGLGAGFDGLASHGGGVLVARRASAKGENFSNSASLWPVLAAFAPESDCYPCLLGSG